MHTGVYTTSKKRTDDPTKTMKREPVPVLAISSFLLLHPAFDDPYKNVDLENGHLTRTVKLVNVFWEFLAALVIFLFCLELFSNTTIAGVGALITLFISHMTFLSTGPVVDTLNTELPAAALLLAAFWCAVCFVHHETKSPAICFGIAMGLLALTKAAFFSIGIVFLLLLIFLDRRKLFRQTDAASPRQLRVTYAALVLALLATLAPWLVRNVNQPRTPRNDRGSRRGNSRYADDFDPAARTRIDLRFKSPATEAATRPPVGVYACGPRGWGKVECR